MEIPDYAAGRGVPVGDPPDEDAVLPGHLRDAHAGPGDGADDGSRPHYLDRDGRPVDARERAFPREADARAGGDLKCHAVGVEPRGPYGQQVVKREKLRHR